MRVKHITLNFWPLSVTLFQEQSLRKVFMQGCKSVQINTVSSAYSKIVIATLKYQGARITGVYLDIIY